MEQPGAEMGFELGHLPAHGGQRQLERRAAAERLPASTTVSRTPSPPAGPSFLPLWEEGPLPIMPAMAAGWKGLPLLRNAKQRGSVAGLASDIAFTPTVKAIQARKGSRGLCARWKTRRLADPRSRRIWPTSSQAQRSVFLATANADGQPYIQHRGGPAGFLRSLDEQTIGFADFVGNRQYITQGNLAGQPEGVSVPDRLRPAPAHQDLGNGEAWSRTMPTWSRG